MSEYYVDKYGQIIRRRRPITSPSPENNHNRGPKIIIIVIVCIVIGCIILICGLSISTTSTFLEFSEETEIPIDINSISINVNRNGVYRYDSQFYVTVPKIDYSDENNLITVYFESYGKGYLWRPEPSCIVLYPGNQRFDPIDYDLTIEENGHFAGTILYQIPVKKGYRYNFIYNCDDDFEDVVLFFGNDLLK